MTKHLFALIFWTSSVVVAFAAGSLRPAQLRCEYLENPIGIDVARPRLSWIVEATSRSGRALTQSAYQILVASERSRLDEGEADFWDSGKVVSDQTLHIEYAGKPVSSGTECFWSVRVWDQDEESSRWSSPASWETGLLEPAAWAGARWIGATTNVEVQPAPMFRRQFELGAKVKRARATVCGLGYYELHLNGEKVGDHLLDPGYTRYDKRVLYVTYDVTDNLKKGDNAIGVMLGHGWFNCQTHAVWDFHKAPWRSAPKFLLMLKAELSDGRTVTMVSDNSWKCSTGPIVFNSIYGGETYDARLEKPGWDAASFNDSGWLAAQLVDLPAGKLAAQMMPPIRANLPVKPVKLAEPKPGVFVYDLGQNLAGHAQLRVRGPAGTEVVMRYGERLGEDGTLDRKFLDMHIATNGPAQQFQTDTYILKGTGEEVYASRFTYHGFQYVEVTGFPGSPNLDNLRGVFLHSDVPVAGEFHCSNPLLNKIWRAARYAYLSNLQGIPTDCPHREKNGWMGDAHLAAEQALFNYHPAAVYTKWINDIADEQRPTGELPGIVPTSGWGYKWGNGPAWDSAFILIPYYMSLYYGDARILASHYDGFRRYIDYLTSRAKGGIVSIGLNDWAPAKTTTPADITDTAYYYKDTQITALAAKLAGKEAAVRQYAELAASIRKAFNAKFYKPDASSYGNGSQTSLSCALYQGLVDSENTTRVLNSLVTAVEAADSHIDTGILGAKYLLNALIENGRADVAWRIVTQTNPPSWGWWIDQGATTLWEQWNGTESRNHIMFGDISAWFYKALAGINPDPAAAGFKHFFVRPQLLGDLTSARADYDSIRGKIVSDWRVEDGEFRLNLTVPANTTATVFIPAVLGSEVEEGGDPARRVKGVKLLRQDPTGAVFQVASGAYRFRAPIR
jgi:alpha-L-rhamnosidase